jgi:hypothetical protein
MLILHARFAWLARAVAGLGFLVALAAPSEALAQCQDPNDCVCVSPFSPQTAFIATITQVGGSFTKLHIDTLVVGAGKTTGLTEGGEASTATSPSYVVGAKVLGYSLDCTDPDLECTVAPGMTEPMEEVDIRSTFGPDGRLACGLHGEVHLGETEATTLLLDGKCYAKLNAYLEAAGVDLSCNDTGPCAVRGAPGASVALPSAGALALVLGGLALAVARRRRR